MDIICSKSELLFFFYTNDIRLSFATNFLYLTMLRSIYTPALFFMCQHGRVLFPIFSMMIRFNSAKFASGR